jgi:acyl-CoA synthetase (AMP-forming)/AMP-acid ligase II
VIGLIFRSEPTVVLAWLACLHAGLRPLIMQYPTRKQSRIYWLDSVSHTIERAGLAGVVCDDYSRGLGAGERAPAILVLPAFDAIPEATSGVPATLLPESFAILQLSSGTTGFRKAIEFRSPELRRHVEDYNGALALDPARDRIVSWLPLYHDMGYVACFVMPILLGVDVVMMDPMTWVQSPGLLFDAIERHAGTVAYLPNFGFEVMARSNARAMPGMRLWVSCSEPVSAATSRRFLAAVGAPDSAFAPCYAMAENIFAVTLGTGLRALPIEGRDVVSCGSPIPGVDLKVLDDEIWVRSPASLTAYVGGEDIRDAEGFYPTGDLGQLVDGELYVTGRKHDLLIQAGRKYMLSDIDLTVNEALPDAKGRVAAVQAYDERLGTQKPLVLIEAHDFFARRDQDGVAEAIRTGTGIEQLEVAFVPPRFLTKTSSGKINRKKSAADWTAAQTRPEGPARSSVEAELREAFPHQDWNAPVGQILDSLSLTILRIILADAGIAYRAEASLEELRAAAAAPADPAEATAPETIHIVSLADRGSLRHLEEKHVERLSRLLGAPVVLEHMCLPPSPIILSDLIFQDWFLPRVDRRDYAVVERQLNKLRRASLILVDDVAEMLFPPAQVYGVLSHAFERDPRADLVSVRWQRYPQLHHRLPLTVVSGADLPLAARTEALAALARYLGKPIFRMAFLPGVADYTEGWEFRAFEGGGERPLPRHVAQPGALVRALANWVAALPVPPARVRGAGGASLEVADLAHYCSRFASADAIEAVLARYDRLCVVGQEASVPYVARRAAELGKTVVRAPSYAPEQVGPLADAFDVMVICGSQGRYPIDKPAVALMAAGPRGWTWNIEDPHLQKLTYVVSQNRAPESGQDWYAPRGMARFAERAVFSALREGVGDFHYRARHLRRARHRAGAAS